MKTSNTLVLSAIAIIFISLVAFNFDLRASFLQGNYKNPFYGFEGSALNDIKNIDVLSGNRMNVRIEYGKKEGIWIKESFLNKVTWNVKGQTLSVDLNEETKADARVNLYDAVIIVVNQPAMINTAATLFGKEGYDYDAGGITIKGFKQNALELNISEMTNVVLENNVLNHLQAVIKKKTGNNKLRVAENNTIQSANFNVEGSGTLDLDNPTIVKTTYQLSDLAQVHLSGKSVRSLAK